MKVISVNIGDPVIVKWRGKEVKTGIYKYPVNKSIHLGFEDVDQDHVIDRRYHGGLDKACYLYSYDHYEYWKSKYPELDWHYGVFGENITLEKFDEAEIKIGSIYRLGTSLVQISRPRQPCFKLGIRFGTQKIIKEFLNSLKTGVYIRVLERGEVTSGDQLILEQENANGVTIKELCQLMFHNRTGDFDHLLDKALSDPLVSDSDKSYLVKT